MGTACAQEISGQGQRTQSQGTDDLMDAFKKTVPTSIRPCDWPNPWAIAWTKTCGTCNLLRPGSPSTKIQASLRPTPQVWIKSEGSWMRRCRRGAGEQLCRIHMPRGPCAALTEGLAGHHQVHWCERPVLATLCKANSSLLQHLLHLAGTSRGQPQQFQDPQHHRSHCQTNRCELESLGPELPGRCHGDIPRNIPLLKVVDNILGLNQLKPGRLQCIINLSCGGNVRQPISFLNLLLDEAVLLVFRFVQISQAPFVAGKYGTWLQHTQDFAVNADAIGCMAGGFDGEDPVEVAILERQFHEIALDAAVQVVNALLLGQRVPTLHLVFI
mmetsp:Transcript_94385/g.163153  ORF Transcript_94385/g.163153 Transcript_94385/m.163153 type:complete len:328 (-) Transcript_94385:624-1607(-)